MAGKLDNAPGDEAGPEETPLEQQSREEPAVGRLVDQNPPEETDTAVDDLPGSAHLIFGVSYTRAIRLLFDLLFVLTMAYLAHYFYGTLQDHFNKAYGNHNTKTPISSAAGIIHRNNSNGSRIML